MAGELALPRITGGFAKGRKLSQIPKSARPTSGRVRQALFNIIGNDLSGVSLLDAYGGSGLLALEAWSRGAAVTICERDRSAVRCIRENISALQASIVVQQGDVMRLKLGLFDGVFVDPPYALEVRQPLAHLSTLCNSWLVLEAANTTAPPALDGFDEPSTRRYGNTSLHIYWRTNEWNLSSQQA